MSMEIDVVNLDIANCDIQNKFKRDKRSCVVVEWVLDYQNIVSNPPHQSLRRVCGLHAWIDIAL